VTGNLLAIARAVGETAPLLFTLATPFAAMTLLIYTDGPRRSERPRRRRGRRLWCCSPSSCC